MLEAAAGRLLRGVQAALPCLVLGLARLVSVKLLGYQVRLDCARACTSQRMAGCVWAWSLCPAAHAAHTAHCKRSCTPLLACTVLRGGL